MYMVNTYYFWRLKCFLVHFYILFIQIYFDTDVCVVGLGLLIFLHINHVDIYIPITLVSVNHLPHTKQPARDDKHESGPIRFTEKLSCRILWDL